MALDPQEFQQRRLQRQQARETARRRLRVRLILAAIALLACAVIIVLVTRNASPAPEPTIPSADTVPAQTEAVQTPPAEAVTSIRIAAVGDVNITQRVVASGTTVQDYNNMLLDVSHLLADPELTLMNLEGVISGPPYGDSRSAPAELIQALKNSGIDGVQLANSYTIHSGISGLSDTVSALEEEHLLPLGAYRNKEKPYTVVNVRGIRIAIAAFTKGTVGMGMLEKGDYGTNILYTDYDTTYQKVDTDRIQAILSDIRGEKPDLTIALVHWGSEFNDNISKTQDKIKTILQEGGVNAIIGTHSHYVQKMSFDAEKGQFVAYSLGDFFSNAQRAGSEYSVVLDLEITKPADGKAKITGYSYTPIFTVREENQPLKVVRINQAIAAYEANYLQKVSPETYEKMRYALERIEARVKAE